MCSLKGVLEEGRFRKAAAGFMPIGGDWGLRLAWKAKSVHPLLSLPSLLVLAPWRGCVFEALV